MSKERITVFLDEESRAIIDKFIRKQVARNPQNEVLNDSKAVVALLKIK